MILGGVTAVAMPNLIKLKESWERKLTVEDILNQVSRLGAWTRARQKAVIITKAKVEPAQALVLPEGWQVRSENNLTWLDNGVCLGGSLTVRQGELVWRYVLEPPFCQPFLQ